MAMSMAGSIFIPNVKGVAPGLKVAEKTLYWWSVHLEQFLKFCRSAGAESSEIPEVAARLFLESLPVGGSAQDFACEQARMALDVLRGEMVGSS